MEVLKRIEELRKKKGWSIYKLATEAELTQSTLSNMYTRKTLPSITTLSCICDALGISLSNFFDDKSSTKNLSQKENELITNFRFLSEQQQNAIIQLINNLK